MTADERVISFTGMIQAIRNHFPAGAAHSDPEGGMFLWVILPGDISARALFDRGTARKIAFVPGDPFYINPGKVNTLRLYFSCADEGTIEEGIKILGDLIREEIEKIT